MIRSKKEKNLQRPIGTAVMLLLMVAALLVSPQNAPVVLFKLCLVTSAAVLGYFIDKLLLPQIDVEDLKVSMEDGTEAERAAATELAKAAMIRRAIIVCGVTLGVCLGL